MKFVSHWFDTVDLKICIHVLIFKMIINGKTTENSITVNGQKKVNRNSRFAKDEKIVKMKIEGIPMTDPSETEYFSSLEFCSVCHCWTVKTGMECSICFFILTEYILIIPFINMAKNGHTKNKPWYLFSLTPLTIEIVSVPCSKFRNAVWVLKKKTKLDSKIADKRTDTNIILTIAMFSGPRIWRPASSDFLINEINRSNPLKISEMVKQKTRYSVNPAYKLAKAKFKNEPLSSSIIQWMYAADYVVLKK